MFWGDVDLGVDREMMIFVWSAGPFQERTRFAGDAKPRGLCDATEVTGLHLGLRFPADLCVRPIHLWQSHMREFGTSIDS